MEGIMTEEQTKHKKGQECFDDLTAGATEAETELNRHAMEEAVLATVASHGLTAPTLWQGFIAMTWTRSDYQAIADVISREIPEGVSADITDIQNELQTAGKTVADNILSGILDKSKVKTVPVAEKYINTMNRQDIFQKVETFGRDFLTSVKEKKDKGEDVDAALGDLLKNLFEQAKAKKLIRENQPEVVDALGFLKSLTERGLDGRKYLGLDCGFEHLNEVLNGLTEGVIVLAGAPSTGKTTLAKQIADHVAQAEKVPVLFWSFEQSKEELRIKSLARLSSINSRDIWKGRLDAEETLNIETAFKTYCEGIGRSLTIIEAGRDDTLDRIRAAALMAKHRAKDKRILLVIDYLQIIPAGKYAPDTLRERVDWNLSELRRLSRDLKSPILVISSENRAAYAGNKRPTLAVLKESGGIEYSADAVLCLWRDKDESEHLTKQFTQKTIRVEAHVLKNRNGELAKVKLNFTPAWSLFMDSGGEKEDLDWSAALGE